MSEPATHHVTRAADIAPIVPELYAPHSAGYTRAQVVGRHIGALHTGTALSFLEPGGHVAPHVHSLEESFTILDGDPDTDARRSRLPARAERLRAHPGGRRARLALRRLAHSLARDPGAGSEDLG